MSLKIPSSLPFSFLAAIGGLICPSARADYPAEILSENPLGYFRFNESITTPTFEGPALNAGSLGAAGEGAFDSKFTKQTPGLFPDNAAAGFSNTPPSSSTAYTGAVIVPHSAELNPEGAFTIEFWVKPNTNTAALLSPVSSMSFTPGRSGYLFYQNAGVWQFRIGVSTSTTASVINGGTVTAGQWQHVAGVYTGGPTGTMTLFVNGVQVATGAALYEANPDAPFRIGSTNAPNRTYDGGVDEVAFYSSALSAADIASRYAAGAGTSAAYASLVQANTPVGYWRLNEALPAYPTAVNSGTMAAAGDGQYRNGALTAATGPNTATGFAGMGAGNSALVCNGTDAYVTSALGLLNDRTAFTVTGWIKRGVEHSARGGYFGQNDLLEFGDADSGSNIEAWIQAVSSNIKSPYEPAYDPLNPPDPLPTRDDKWVFIALTGNSLERALYLDGERVGVNTAAFTGPTFGSNAFKFNIGGGGIFNAAGDYFRGEIDEVAVLDKALSAGRVQSLYDAARDNIPVKLLNDPPAIAPAAPTTIYATTTFSLDADPAGTPPLTYQWSKDGTDIAGPAGTARVFTKTDAVTADSGNYRVVVTNPFGNKTSQNIPVTVVVPVAPSFDAAPTSQLTYTGSTFRFRIAVSGTAPFTYQWMRNGVDIPGANSDTYNVAASSASTGSYSVRVTNVHSTVTSGEVTASLNIPVPGGYEELMVSLAPVALWRFEETEGLIAHDDFGGNDATFTSEAVLGVDGVSTGTGKAATISGNQAVIGNPANLAFTGPITLAAWVRPAQLPSDFGNILSQGYGGADNRELVLRYSTGGGFYFGSYSGSTGGIGVAGTIDVDHTDQWVHVVGTFDGAAYRLYINGRRQGPVRDARRPQPIEYDWSIGAKANGERRFTGDIDEAAVFNKSLSAGEVNALYAAGKGIVGGGLEISALPGGGEQALASSTLDSDAEFTVETPNIPSPNEIDWIHQPAGTWRSDGQATTSGSNNVSHLISPEYAVTKTGMVGLTFSHRYSFEVDAARNWDGGAVEVSVNDGPFVYVAAPSFSAGGYTGLVQSAPALLSKDGFIGNSAGHPAFLTSKAVLTHAIAGDKIRVRFTAAYDAGAAGNLTPAGWEIDSMQLTQGGATGAVVRLPDFGNLQRSDTLTAPWVDVGGFGPFYLDTATAPRLFFRLAP